MDNHETRSIAAVAAAAFAIQAKGFDRAESVRLAIGSVRKLLPSDSLDVFENVFNEIMRDDNSDDDGPDRGDNPQPPDVTEIGVEVRQLLQKTGASMV